jgi:hypothetical protein
MEYHLFKFFAPLVLLYENPTTWIVLAFLIIVVCGLLIVRSVEASTLSWNKVLRMAAASVGFLALVSTTWLAPTLIAGALDNKAPVGNQIPATDKSSERNPF